jgi:hypothetical protein
MSEVVAEVEDAEIDMDKPLEDMSVEELEQVYAASEEGETDSSEPEAEVDEVVAETEVESEEPEVNDDDSNTEAKESLEDMVKAMRKEMQGLQKLNAQTQTKLGEALKAKNSVQNEVEEDVDPYVDPDKFFEKKTKQAEAKRQAELQAEQEKLQGTKDYVTARVPEFESMVDDMSTELKSLLSDDPDADLYASNFKANPYIVDPLTLLFAGRTAELKREIAKLKGKANSSENGKGDLIKKINRLGRNKSTVNGSGSNSSSNGKLNNALTARQIEGTDLDKLQLLYEQSLEN